MRNISKGVAFKYHYNGEASIEEEFHLLMEMPGTGELV